MSKPLCLVTAPVATRSGYGAHSRDICRALIKLDRYDVKIWPVRWGKTPMNALHIDDPNDKIIIDRLLQSPELPNQPEIHIHVVIPNEFSPVAKYNIGITAGLETTACPPQWIEGMNRMNLNLVSSEHSKQVASASQFDKIDNRTKQKIGVIKLEKVKKKHSHAERLHEESQKSLNIFEAQKFSYLKRFNSQNEKFSINS